MTTGIVTRRIAIATAGAALAAMGALTACSPTTEKEAPSSTTTPTSAAPTSAAPSETTTSLTPTEKAVGPGITNSFSPSVRVNPPGAVCQQLVNGVCVR